MNRLAAYLVIAFLGWTTVCTAQMTVNTNQTRNAQANEAFANAADTWASEFRDDITVTIHYGFSVMGEGTVSMASAGTQTNSYTDFWDAIGNDITSGNDQAMFNGLPTGTSFSLYINQTNEAGGSSFSVPYVDNDNGANNTSVTLTTANAKALGLHAAHAPSIDGFIEFNRMYAWDYDPSDGIESDHLDFYGTAMHELGHALGFESGVDALDTNGEGQFSDDEFPFVTSLDFTRFSSEGLLAGADIDWTADERAKFFSIDGGLTAAAGGSDHWSTGQFFGDGEQASHWKDGSGLGLMEPTTDFGLVNSISAMDLLAMDVIGYDRGLSAIPEPGSLAVVILLGGGLAIRRRRS